MPKLSREFVSSDSWIFLALFYAQRGTPVGLRGLVATADGINHAIPTADELDGALNRLLAAHLIAVEDDGYAMTGKGIALITNVIRPRRAVLDIWDDLDRLIACPCCGPKLKSVRRRVTITKTNVKSAYAAYIEALRPKRAAGD